MLVVLTIVAGMFAVAIYGMNVLTASDLRDEAMRLTSVMKSTWAQAAIKHANYRLVLDLDSNKYWTEVTDAAVVKRLAADDSSEGKLDEQRQDRANEQNAAASDLFGKESDPWGINQPTSFEKAKTAAIDPKNFKDGVQIYEVLTARQERPITSGKVAVGFYPSGFQEPVIIVLKNKRGEYYSLVNEPLTGRVKIYSKLVDDREKLDQGESDD